LAFATFALSRLNDGADGRKKPAEWRQPRCGIDTKLERPMSDSIVPRVFFIAVLLLAVSLFVAFITGHVDLEEIPETNVFESTFSFHGEYPPDCVELEERLHELDDCVKIKDGEQ
jgi:hypothetical protein